MADERQVRRHPPTVLRVRFEQAAGGDREEATPWDASLGGMFLETTKPLDTGALVALELETPHATVAAEARVLWIRAESQGADRPAGMAVRFLDLPEDVSEALRRALLVGLSQEKTILGVGGATKEQTQLGIPAATAARAPRETQLGIAPPANAPSGSEPEPKPATEPEPEPAPAPTHEEEPASSRASATRHVAEKPRLELASTSEAIVAHAPAKSGPPPRPRRGGGRLLFLVVAGGAAAAGYLYREPLAQMLLPPPHAPTTPAETASAPAPTAAELEDASEPRALAAGRELDSGQGPSLDASASDAAAGDAGAGARDAGARDGAGRAGGR